MVLNRQECDAVVVGVVIVVVINLFSQLQALKTPQSPSPSNFESLKLPLLLRNPRRTPSQTLSADLHRLPSLRAPVVSAASAGSGQYLVSLHLGTPPQPLLLVADTGSDLVWSRCSACRNCSLHPPTTAFLPRHSSSFSPLHCYSPACRLVPPSSASPCPRSRLHSACRFHYSYADGSSTSGFFSRESATLTATSGRRLPLPGLRFGCSFRVSGPSLAGARGVLGLGRGQISFASQIARRSGADRFSYCLMDYTISPPPTSYLVLGPAATPTNASTPTVRYTPLLSNPLSPTFYYVRILSVSVDGRLLPIDPAVWALGPSGNGGTVVDSGTTLSFLAQPAYRQILAAVRRRVRLPMAKKASEAEGFDMCVNVTGVKRPKFPKLAFKLLGGAVFAPPPRNYFIDAAEGVKCLALQAVSPEAAFSVIGNLMQQGFLFVFDRDTSRLGFSRADCALP